MDLEALRRWRRLSSAVVALSAIALVMARARGPGSLAEGDVTGKVAAIVFLISFVTFVVVWRKEHAAAERAFAERECQQLAALRLQIELAKLKADKADKTDSAGAEATTTAGASTDGRIER